MICVPSKNLDQSGLSPGSVLDLSLHLFPHLVYASSESSGKTDSEPWLQICTNGADPDDSVMSHLDLHVLSNYSITGLKRPLKN